jgi:hypothetical protein
MGSPYTSCFPVSLWVVSHTEEAALMLKHGAIQTMSACADYGALGFEPAYAGLVCVALDFSL